MLVRPAPSSPGWSLVVNMAMDGLYFLKLGGSLITDKNATSKARVDIITRLANEISAARRINPTLKILVGHGSGSFGHSAAHRFNVHQGINNPSDWYGFNQVWYAARSLNQVVLDIFQQSGLPVVALPPSASVMTQNGTIHHWEIEPISSALNSGMIPLIQGDVIFDRGLGAVILSTEDFFTFLASQVQPQWILLAGKEPGVWKDYPRNSEIIPHITPANFAGLKASIHASASIDVTGGMISKVDQMLAIVKNLPDTKIRIFSALQPGSLNQALSGESIGTLITT